MTLFRRLSPNFFPMFVLKLSILLGLMFTNTLAPKFAPKLAPKLSLLLSLELNVMVAHELTLMLAPSSVT